MMKCIYNFAIAIPLTAAMMFSQQPQPQPQKAYFHPGTWCPADRVATMAMHMKHDFAIDEQFAVFDDYISHV